MIAWSTRALGQDAQTQPLVREPASPEVGAQVEAMCASALQALEEHCTKWSDEQRAIYVEGVRIGLLNGLTKPLGEDRVAAFEESFTALAKGFGDYVPGASSRFSHASLSMKAMKWAIARKARTFADRERGSEAASELEAVLKQVPFLVEMTMGGLREGFPEVSPEDMTRVEDEHRARLQGLVADVLTPGLKRPLTTQELAEMRARTADLCSRAQQIVEMRTVRRGADDGSATISPANMAANMMASLLLSATSPPATEESQEYVRVLNQISQQHTERSAQWMREQQERFRATFVTDLLAPAAEANDRSLFTVAPLFFVPQLICGQGSCTAY